MKTLTNDIAFGESLRWGPDDRLWFADWGTHKVLSVDADGGKEVQLHLDHDRFQPLCFDWLPDGRLLATSGTSLVAREPDGSVSTHAQLGGEMWNEVVVDARGHAF